MSSIQEGNSPSLQREVKPVSIFSSERKGAVYDLTSNKKVNYPNAPGTNVKSFSYRK